MIRPLVLMLLSVAGSSASCASSSDEPRPAASTPPTIEAAPADKKARAPVELALAASGTRDALELTLTVRATADIPRAVARFTLPGGATLVSGSLEHELGARARDSETTARVVVRVPATGSPLLYGGVDCHLSHGVKLYAVTELALAPTGVEPTLPGPGLERDGLRATPARPQR